MLALAGSAFAEQEERLVLKQLSGNPGGSLKYSLRSEPKTLNPVTATDAVSKEVIQRLNADLIHINRETQQTEPALAKSWKVSAGGRAYVLELRRGLRFSDGAPMDARDVVFSFQVYLDEKTHSPQRDLLILNGKPITVRQTGTFQVAFDLPEPYAAAERLFDGFAILPRHVLEGVWKAGKLADAWGLGSPPSQVVGMGPFRLKEYVPGERLALERNPYYWKADRNGNRLPYLAEAVFTFAGSEDMETLRFQSGETDVISRVGAKNFALLARDQAQRGYAMRALGPGLEYSFLFFNLNDVSHLSLPQVSARQRFLGRRAFREAVSRAIDRDAIARLVYLGYAAPLAGPVPAGNRAWVNGSLPKPAPSVAAARGLLAADGFSWSRDGALLDPAGARVEFSIVTSAGNADRVQMATLIQSDLKELGIDAHVVGLEFRSLLDRVLRTKDYDACLLSLASGDADPNPDINVWLSSGGTHLWNPGQQTPATPWEAEIDGLMRRQMVELRYAERKRLFDRVQAIAMRELPVTPLVSPAILVGARQGLGNFRPAAMGDHVLWNIEELNWQARPGGAGR